MMIIWTNIYRDLKVKKNDLFITVNYENIWSVHDSILRLHLVT